MDASGLSQWLKFSDADLAANRDGTFGGSQSNRLLRSGAWRIVVGPPLVIGGVVVSLVVDSSLITVLALLATGAGLYITWRGFAFIVDWRDGSVAYVTAPLKLRTVHTRNGTSYYVGVGPVIKGITKSAYMALHDGAMLHLYYAPGCRSLLSVEPASASEPKPPHPFGPDSAHAWDRLRWSWVLMTMGVLALAIGLHQVTVAHPARTIAVEGTMTNYVETHGRSTSRTIYMDDGNQYKPQNESAYEPPAPDWSSLIGEQLTLYVNAGTADILAVNVGGTTYAGDWYLHPEHQTTYEINNGSLVAALGVMLVAVGVLLMVRDRRLAESAPGTESSGRNALYAPPAVRPATGILNNSAGAVVAFGIVALFIVVILVSVK